MIFYLIILKTIFSLNYIPKYSFIETNNTFKVPNGLERAVDFWVDVYAKYDTNQMVIHDSKYFVVYEVIDISDINEIKYLPESLKKELIDSRIIRVKKMYRDALLEIARSKDEISNSDTFLNSIVEKFKGVEEKNIFYMSARLDRIREQKGQRSNFKTAIEDSSKYIKTMEQIFNSYKLPVELTRLPYVESFFSPHAYSYKAAAGIWQFMKGSGKDYLKVEEHYDERKDPIISTHAAAKMLKNNFKKLQSWPLAVTAYNHGLGGMKKAIKKTGSKDLLILIEKFNSSSFGFASKNFYAEFLAALYVDKNKNLFFEDINPQGVHNTKEIITMRSVNISELENIIDVGRDTIKYYNPAIAKKFFYNYKIKLPRGARVRIPASHYEKILIRLTYVKKLKNFVRVI